MNDYSDIMDHPHYQSKKRPHMSMYDRAAQFSPFAALTGYEGIVSEAARFTNERVELGDKEKDILNAKLQIIGEHIKEHPELELTYFQKDKNNHHILHYFVEKEEHHHTISLHNRN